ncbi:Uncharacterized protein dnm_085350 [Desulfonema magnum]|uniref:Uncharacterized protein n=1 Tax=Desulfonema magnum TaxID=45655 RepID=A0A975BWJ4_9BACT|nr:Uncharacterized protein dnm_085350 [Desulfonema magnum]
MKKPGFKNPGFSPEIKKESLKKTRLFGYKYPIKSFFIHSFFRERRRNPAFSLRVSESFREKSRVFVGEKAGFFAGDEKRAG